MGIEQTFDAFDQASRLGAHIHAVRIKQEQLRDVIAWECGNCDKWMTYYCKWEKEYGLFRTMSSPGCTGFVLSSDSQILRDRFESELAELTTKLRGG